MIRMLALTFNLMSMNVLASYECDLQLAHTEDLVTTIAAKKAVVDRTLKSGTEGILIVESEKKKKKVSQRCDSSGVCFCRCKDEHNL